jgi:ketosteroid isomerase-like protein
MRSVVEGKKTISAPKTDVDRKRRRLEELAVGKRKEREQSEEVLLESQKENIDRKDKEVRKDERHYEQKADFIKGDQKLE